MSGYHPDWQQLILEGMWTTTPPTEPGWYWVKREDEHREMYRNGAIAYYSGHSVMYPGSSARYDLSSFSYWLGPLLVPEPPIDETPK